MNRRRARRQRITHRIQVTIGLALLCLSPALSQASPAERAPGARPAAQLGVAAPESNALEQSPLRPSPAQELPTPRPGPAQELPATPASPAKELPTPRPSPAQELPSRGRKRAGYESFEARQAATWFWGFGIAAAYGHPSEASRLATGRSEPEFEDQLAPHFELSVSLRRYAEAFVFMRPFSSSVNAGAYDALQSQSCLESETHQTGLGLRAEPLDLPGFGSNQSLRPYGLISLSWTSTVVDRADDSRTECFETTQRAEYSWRSLGLGLGLKYLFALGEGWEEETREHRFYLFAETSLQLNDFTHHRHESTKEPLIERKDLDAAYGAVDHLFVTLGFAYQF